VNFYPRHIGDYLRNTAHLSLLEHGVFTRLMDVYYTREGPIPDDQAARLIGVRSKEEREALAAVLQEFFVRDADAWRQSRCDQEIEQFKDKQRKAKASAEARWAHTERNANASPNAMRTHSEGNAPSNQEPITKEEDSGRSAIAEPTAKPLSVKDLVAEGVDRQVASDWLVLRKAKRLPLTATAWAETKAEGLKVGLDAAQTVAHAVGSNWAGFKASWHDRDKATGRPGAARSDQVGVIV